MKNIPNGSFEHIIKINTIPHNLVLVKEEIKIHFFLFGFVVKNL